MTKGVRGAIAKHIALRGVVMHRICSAIRLKGTLGTACQTFIYAACHNFSRLLAVKNLFIRMSVEMSEFESVIFHFCQHSAFIACVNGAVVIENYGAGN